MELIEEKGWSIFNGNIGGIRKGNILLRGARDVR